MADVTVGAPLGAGMSGAPSGAAAVAGPISHETDDPAHAAPGDSERIREAPTQSAADMGGSVTQAQLRRFIKSRPYVPMHELRRRFELNGATDDVSPIRVADGTVYVGLPGRESQFIAELVRQGEVGVELCHDPPVPIVVGVFPMRPIAR